jgi:hypothetical protein
MSLLDLFRRKDPTDDWPECRPAALVFDIGRGELNGIPLGAPMSALRALGRPGNARPQRMFQWDFAPLGLEVRPDQHGRIVLFTCFFQAYLGDTELGRYPDFQPCRLSFRFADGTLRELTADTPRARIEAFLGPLTQKAEGSDEYGPHVVTCGGARIGFEFDENGRWTLVDVEPAADA